MCPYEFIRDKGRSSSLIKEGHLFNEETITTTITCQMNLSDSLRLRLCHNAKEKVAEKLLEFAMEWIFFHSNYGSQVQYH